jgi:hypothetical protein
MDVLRYTVIEGRGGISFIADAAALPALCYACAENPASATEMLELVERHYRGLQERVLNGLAIFDERNTPGQYDAVHQALDFCSPHEQPPFRIVDDRTREASLQPVRAGAVLFNLAKKRIVQLQNSYQEITRTGRGRIHDGQALTGRVFRYSLPREWEIVP